MQHAVDDRLAHIRCVRRTDDHVAQLVRPRGDIRAVDRERQHVRRLRLGSVSRVQLGHPPLIDELDRHVALVDTGGLGCKCAQPTHLRERGQIVGQLQ
jgi:hypothetical protein